MHVYEYEHVCECDYEHVCMGVCEYVGINM